MKRISIVLLFFLATSLGYAQKLLEVPGFNQFAKIDTTGISVLPSGRYVKPAGKTVQITNDPYGMAISNNGLWAITLHNGAFTRIDLRTNQAIRFPKFGTPNKLSPYGKSSFLGVAFSMDSQKVYLSGGDAGTVLEVDLQTAKVLRTFNLDGDVLGVNFEDSFTSDLTVLPSQNELLVLDRANFRMVRINLTDGKLTHSIPTGRLPFGVSLSLDQKYAFVANVGMYSYPLVEGTYLLNLQSQYIPYHPYGNDTKESREGTIIDRKKIPGLGDPRSDEAMSVFQIDY
jgi:DNA-binding beta-propeller fold protein YncE